MIDNLPRLIALQKFLKLPDIEDIEFVGNSSNAFEYKGNCYHVLTLPEAQRRQNAMDEKRIDEEAAIYGKFFKNAELEVTKERLIYSADGLEHSVVSEGKVFKIYLFREAAVELDAKETDAETKPSTSIDKPSPIKAKENKAAVPAPKTNRTIPGFIAFLEERQNSMVTFANWTYHFSLDNNRPRILAWHVEDDRRKVKTIHFGINDNHNVVLLKGGSYKHNQEYEIPQRLIQGFFDDQF